MWRTRVASTRARSRSAPCCAAAWLLPRYRPTGAGRPRAAGADGEARRIFGQGTGTAVTEGNNWAQADLAGTLGALRQRGGVDFFQGALARLMSDQVSQMGGSLSLESLRNAIPLTGAPAG